jgi:hypothetical protein
MKTRNVLLIFLLFHQILFAQSKWNFLIRGSYHAPVFAEYNSLQKTNNASLFASSEYQSSFLPNFGIESGVAYSLTKKIKLGTSIEFIRSNSYKSHIFLDETADKYERISNRIQLLPFIKFMIFEKAKFGIHTRIAPLIGWVNMTEYKTDFDDAGPQKFYKLKYKGGFSYGASLGLEGIYKINQRIKLSAEIFFQPCIYNVWNADVLEYKENNIDKFNTLTPSQKTIINDGAQSINQTTTGLRIGIYYCK